MEDAWLPGVSYDKGGVAWSGFIEKRNQFSTILFWSPIMLCFMLSSGHVSSVALKNQFLLPTFEQ